MAQSLRCRDHGNDASLCMVKPLRDMEREIGLWGCAPWIGIWFLLVFKAPVPYKAKFQIFLVGLGITIWTFVDLAIGNAPGRDHTPLIVYILMAITGLPLILAYFILSYKALAQENRRRNALYALLGEEAWQRLYYCTVHGNVVYP